MTRNDAVRQMIDAVGGSGARSFHVGLVGYFIEGQPYIADALTIDGDSTLDVRATEDGLSCFAFFPPARLAPETVAACGVQAGPDGTPFVIVRLEVRQQDIWLVAETVSGEAQPWFCDLEVIATRRSAFAHDQKAWLHSESNQRSH